MFQAICICFVCCILASGNFAAHAQSVMAPAPSANPSYPSARRGDVVETQHGVAVADPYRWLEAMDAAETRDWVTAQNALADRYLAGIPGRETLRARIQDLMSYERFGLPHHRGKRYFWTHSDGQQAQAIVLSASTPDAKPKIVLDPNRISTDGSLALAGWSPGANDRIAYGIAKGGGDWQTWRVRDLATGRDWGEELPHIKYYYPAFNRHGTGLYYSRFPAPAPGTELTATDHDC